MGRGEGGGGGEEEERREDGSKIRPWLMNADVPPRSCRDDATATSIMLTTEELLTHTCENPPLRGTALPGVHDRTRVGSDLKRPARVL